MTDVNFVVTGAKAHTSIVTIPSPSLQSLPPDHARAGFGPFGQGEVQENPTQARFSAASSRWMPRVRVCCADDRRLDLSSDA